MAMDPSALRPRGSRRQILGMKTTLLPRSNAKAAEGWSSSSKAQPAAIDASRMNGFSICDPAIDWSV
jgi:hypothetical protein